MFSKRMLGGFAVASLMGLAGANVANAAFFTMQGTWDVNSAANLIAPPIVDPKAILDGGTWTNTYAAGQIRTLFVAQITGIRNGGLIDSIRGTGNETNKLIVIAMLDGVLNSPTQATFSKGRAGVFEVSNATLFDPDNPTTWGFGTAVAPGAEAEYKLVAPDNVLPGIIDSNKAAQFTFGANQVNTSTLNTAVATQNQARLLFAEDSTPLTSAPGNNFVNINLAHPDNVAILAALGLAADKITGEGIIVVPRVTNFDTGDPTPALNAAQRLIINDIGIWAGLGTVGGGAGNGFANFGTGLFSDYTPVADFSTGDFQTSGQTEVAPGVFVGVPEPATALLGLFGVVAIAARRRQKA